jgi:hypothetical protein
MIDMFEVERQVRLSLPSRRFWSAKIQPKCVIYLLNHFRTVHAAHNPRDRSPVPKVDRRPRPRARKQKGRAFGSYH